MIEDTPARYKARMQEFTRNGADRKDRGAGCAAVTSLIHVGRLTNHLCGGARFVDKQAYRALGARSRTK